VIACLGLAFKADIDDLRSSPAVEITAKLAAKAGMEILAVEPNVTQLPPELKDTNVSLVDLETALERADILTLLVDHKEFKRLPASRIAEKSVVDTRGIWR
jgi:UDP-N-acetyl-D-mannosaminuronic acid dehydrogenase